MPDNILEKQKQKHEKRLSTVTEIQGITVANL